MASSVPFSTTEYPLVSDPIFADLYCAANCSCRDGACACEPATIVVRISAAPPITLFNVCGMTKVSSSFFGYLCAPLCHDVDEAGASAKCECSRHVFATARRRTQPLALPQPRSYRRLPAALSASSRRSYPVQEEERLPRWSWYREPSADRRCPASSPVHPCRPSALRGSGCTSPADRPTPADLPFLSRNPLCCWRPLSPGRFCRHPEYLWFAALRRHR